MNTKQSLGVSIVSISLPESHESHLVFISIGILMSPKSHIVSWVSISLAETHESPVVSETH